MTHQGAACACDVTSVHFDPTIRRTVILASEASQCLCNTGGQVSTTIFNPQIVTLCPTILWRSPGRLATAAAAAIKWMISKQLTPVASNDLGMDRNALPVPGSFAGFFLFITDYLEVRVMHSATTCVFGPNFRAKWPCYRLNTNGCRAFSVPKIWKSVWGFIRDPTVSADCFRRFLKTYLFAPY